MIDNNSEIAPFSTHLNQPLCSWYDEISAYLGSRFPVSDRDTNTGLKTNLDIFGNSNQSSSSSLLLKNQSSTTILKRNATSRCQQKAIRKWCTQNFTATTLRNIFCAIIIAERCGHSIALIPVHKPQENRDQCKYNAGQTQLPRSTSPKQFMLVLFDNNVWKRLTQDGRHIASAFSQQEEGI